MILFVSYFFYHTHPEAEGILRAHLESLKGCSVILMGSRKHLLSKIVSKPDSPFASFGYDIEFQHIPYNEYHSYILERLKVKKLKLSFEVSCAFQDLLDRNPEPINMLGAELVDSFSAKTLELEDIYVGLERLLNRRQTRFEEQLSSLSVNEEQVLTQLSRHQPVQAVNSSDFLKTIPVSHRTVSQIVKRLEQRGLIERWAKGYGLVDPLLRQYILKFR